MGKKDAKDFAATKHKGLPQKVNEGVNFLEMMRETEQTLEEMINELHNEITEYKMSGYMGDKLRDAMELHRHSKNKLMGETMHSAFYEDDTLSELAALAGLREDAELNECGDMGMSSEDRLNVSTNMSSDGTKSVNISAQGEKAEELLSMLKLAGMGGRDRPVVAMIDRDEEMMDEDRPIEYPNTPREKYDNIETQFIGGDGEVAGKEKRMHAGGSARFSDNPLAVDEMLGEEWSALYDSILIKKEMEEGSIKGGDKPGELTGTWSADPPKKGQPNVPPPVPMDPVYPAEKPKATSTPGTKR